MRTVGILGAALALTIIAFLTLAALDAAGLHMPIPDDPLGLAALLAILAGGVFVVGRLLALRGPSATVLAQQGMRTTAAIEAQQIRGEIEARIRRFYEVARAIHLDDWRLALAETERLLAELGEVPGARFELAERLFAEVARAYRDDRTDPTLGTGPVTHTVNMSSGPPLKEARDHLQAARQRQEGPPGRAAALCAILAGRYGDWDRVRALLREPVDGNPLSVQCGELLRKPVHLAMLCGSCTTEFELAVLGRELGMELPAPWDALERSLRDLKGGHRAAIGWWAWREPGDPWAGMGFPFPRAFTIALARPASPTAPHAYYLTLATGGQDTSAISGLWLGRIAVAEDELKVLTWLCPIDEAGGSAP